MYVDKKLGGVNAVHTLSRLNRTHAHGWKSKYRISQFRHFSTVLPNYHSLPLENAYDEYQEIRGRGSNCTRRSSVVSVIFRSRQW